MVLRTSLSSSAISAIPPALSVTGPYASNATTIPARDNIAVTAIAMPKIPAIRYVMIIAAHITNAGRAVASIDTASPWITFVP